MAQAARLVTRRLWLAIGVSSPLGWSLAVPRLLVRRESEHLRISAPQIRFLTGKPLEKLKNGTSVSFITQVLLCANEAGTSVLSQAFDRFTVSYDIWEEKFSATRGERTLSHLTVPACEAWCLDERTPIPPSLTATRPFWIKLELRAEDPKESAGIVTEPGINLTRLVEIFSRNQNQQPRWLETGGPLRLQDL